MKEFLNRKQRRQKPPRPAKRDKRKAMQEKRAIIRMMRIDNFKKTGDSYISPHSIKKGMFSV